MKIRNILLGMVLLCSTTLAFSQVKVTSDGALRLGNQALTSSNPGAKIFVQSNHYSSDPKYGVYSKMVQINNAPSGDCIGVYGIAENSVTSYPARYIGVLGYGSSSQHKVSIGVAGVAQTSSSSIGVFGTSFGLTSIPTASMGALYAGYFSGPVTVNGTLTATTVTQSSDERLKKNMLFLSNEKALDKLMLLKPLKYNLKQIETEADSVTKKGEKIKFKEKRYHEKSQEFQKKHYGLLAQDLQKVYPELVYEGGDGYLEINYIELIPILLQAIQEQQAAIEKLQNQQPSFGIAGAKTKNMSSINLLTDEQAQLQQNAPNPFSERTEIGYYLPSSVQKASLYIYDMNGRQVKHFDLQQKGQASIVVAGSQLQAGMYLYTLITDGKEVDTKRMILTK